MFCGNRGYVAMSNAATEPLSVANVWVPPPRNKKPIAMPMAMCAPWDSPEAPPPPDAASAAAAAAAPCCPASKLLVSKRRRSRRSSRSEARSPVPAITHDSATAATPTHVSSVGRSISAPSPP